MSGNGGRGRRRGRAQKAEDNFAYDLCVYNCTIMASIMARRRSRERDEREMCRERECTV